MRISDWSSDVCSSDLVARADLAAQFRFDRPELRWRRWGAQPQRVYRKIGIKKQPLGVCRAHSPRPCIDHRAVLNVDHGVRNIAERKCANRRAYSPSLGDQDDVKIGRASCRECVCQYVEISGVAVELKKK